MGQVLADRYELASPLGRGGMGQVWEARDIRLGRKVALKLLTAGGFPASPGSPGSEIPGFDLDARRFAREAAVTAELAHPCVPAIFDTGICDSGLYLVMELVDGCTIGDLVAEHGPLPVGWAAGIAGQVAAVLAIAHQRGILHRDIKPQNVMLTRDGTAKILDFGVAGISSQRITSTGVTVGTPGYIAPEQLHSLPATPQTDLYSLGCLLYEMLAGEPVFTATSPAGLIGMHVEQAPPPLPRHDVPPQLQSLLWQLLDKAPARRPADARQAYDLLLPFVSPPGPLGDIDPDTGNRTGLQLYSRLLTRLCAPAQAVTDLGGTGVAAAGVGVPDLGSAGPRGADRGGAGLGSAGVGGAGLRGADSSRADPGRAGPGRAGLPVPPPATQAPATRNDGLWTVRHSLWLLPAVLFGGFGAWLSFGYIAARHQRPGWVAAAVAYLALTATAFIVTATSPDNGNGPLPVSADIGISVLAVLWPASIVHTLWVNFKTRLPLLSA